MFSLIEKLKEFFGVGPQPKRIPVRVEKKKPNWWEPKQ